MPLKPHEPLSLAKGGPCANEVISRNFLIPVVWCYGDTFAPGGHDRQQAGHLGGSEIKCGEQALSLWRRWPMSGRGRLCPA